jgi:hypothetical protein
MDIGIVNDSSSNQINSFVRHFAIQKSVVAVVQDDRTLSVESLNCHFFSS